MFPFLGENYVWVVVFVIYHIDEVKYLLHMWWKGFSKRISLPTLRSYYTYCWDFFRYLLGEKLRK